jgi:hypothetical protein
LRPGRAALKPKPILGPKVSRHSMRDTTSRGDVTEFEVATALLRQGRKLLRPLSSACRYDLLMDNEDGTFTRIQCKTGILREGRVEFRLYSISGHRPTAVSYGGQVDAFGVYCPQTRESYLVPVAALGSRGAIASLRVLPSRNGQVKKVRLASDYLVDSPQQSLQSR